METESTIARRLAKLEERIGADAGDGLVYVTPGMRGLLTAISDLEEARNPQPVPARRGVKGLLADIEDCERMIAEREAGEAANPSEPEPPEKIVPLPRPVLPRPEPPPHLPQRPPPRAPAPTPEPKPAAKKPSASYNWEDL